MTSTLPLCFMPHGGGPWPWAKDLMGNPQEWNELEKFLQSIPLRLLEKKQEVKAILCITAHWEEPVPTLSSAQKPEMYYDYYGFPAHTYQIKYPAPGSPKLCQRVSELLNQQGIPNAQDPNRGLDHGTFVPIAVAWPNANIPVVQLSLIHGFNPKQHFELGKALQALRNEGILIVGSGLTFHNLRALFGASQDFQSSIEFDMWLSQTLLEPEAILLDKLSHWTDAPGARFCHPREEHLAPLFVLAGAGIGDTVEKAYSEDFKGFRHSGFIWHSTEN
jgi:aromatic ring-opening dioxygenase catalytic subunit (LigB family)